MMDVTPHKKRQHIEWLYTRRYWCYTYQVKDSKKSIKLIRTRANKTIGGTGVENRPHEF